MFRKILKTFGLVPDRPKKIHEWRLQPTNGGLYCFFDPSIETIVILPLTTSRGAVSINEYGSVSASVEGEGSVLPHQVNLFRRIINAATPVHY